MLEADFVETLSVTVGTGCEQLLCRRHACFNERGRVSARLPTYFLLPESRQRAAPLLPPIPPAAPAGNLRRQPLGAVRQNSLRVFDAPFKHVAADWMTMLLHLCGATASPNSLPSQAWAQGAMLEPDSFFEKLIASTAISHWA